MTLIDLQKGFFTSIGRVPAGMVTFPMVPSEDTTIGKLLKQSAQNFRNNETSIQINFMPHVFDVMIKQIFEN